MVGRVRPGLGVGGEGEEKCGSGKTECDVSDERKKMTKDEIPNDEGNPNDEIRKGRFCWDAAVGVVCGIR